MAGKGLRSGGSAALSWRVSPDSITGADYSGTYLNHHGPRVRRPRTARVNFTNLIPNSPKADSNLDGSRDWICSIRSVMRDT